MRLIKDDGHGNLILGGYDDENVPRYAILSHTWGANDEEVTFKDLMEGTGKNKAGYSKIEFCRKQAARDGLQYFWVDTCCIDKSSSAELTEAINSMFRWYQDTAKCYVYLSDVSVSGRATVVSPPSPTWEAAFRESRWFRRGWTLQDLIAPASVEFFSREGDRLGSKKSLEQLVHEITGIPIAALRGAPLTDFKIEERLSWADHRETKRQEDKVYSLLGIFNVHMPLLYGEGREKAFLRLREEIGKSLNPPVEQVEDSLSPSSTVPFRRDADFVDRRTSYGHSTLLEQIEQRCTAAASRVALVGIGGAGKSQLAIEYCYLVRERSPNTWVFWIYASNKDRFEQGYREIAERVNIPGRNDPKLNIFELVTRWLRDKSKGTWLLVLDNLTDDIFSPTFSPTSHAAAFWVLFSDGTGQSRRPLSAHVPRTQNGTILITTCTRSLAIQLVEPRDMIVIDPMTDTDAIALLKKKLNTPAKDEDLLELAGILEYMPLAIVQAAGYIQQREARCSVRQYIEAFRKNEKRRTRLLKHEGDHFRRDHFRRDREAHNSIIITWQIWFNWIREKYSLSADLLSLMSYFDPQGIPEDVLKVQSREEVRDSMRQKGNDVSDSDKNADEDTEDNSASEISDDDMFEEAMERLRSYFFVSIGEDGRTFEMQGLVQLATREWLEMDGEDERWKAQFLRKLNAVFPSGDHQKWGLCEMLFPHAKSAERHRPIDHRSLREWAQILRKAAWYAWTKGNYCEAERMCESSVRALEKLFGAEDVDTLCGMEILALVLQSQGKYTEAEEMSRHALTGREKVLGVDHPWTLTSVSNLAQVLQSQGKYAQAEEMSRRALAGREKALGVDHPSTLTTINNLGLLYLDLGKLAEAEPMFLRALAGRKQVLRPDHPSIFDTVNGLVNLYRGQGRLDDATQAYMQALAEKDEFLTSESPIDIDQVDNDDTLSEVSSGPPSLISDSSNSSMQDKYNDAVEYMVDVFCAEENLGLIYRKAVQNSTADKFRHNHDQLLKLYFKQMRQEIKTESEKATIRLLRTRSCRNKVTCFVLKLLQPFDLPGENRLTTSTLAKRKTERNFSLNQMLQGNVVDPESYNDHKKQHDGNKDHEDDASDSNESSTQSEDEPLIENPQSPLQAIDAFLTGGKAFSHLKVNLACLLHPPQSFKDAISSESIFVVKQYISRNLDNMADNDKEKVLELRAEGHSSAKIAEFLLENTVASPITFVEKNLTSTFEKDIMNIVEETLKDEVALGDGQTSTSGTALTQPALTGHAEQDKPILHDRPQLVTWTCSCGVQLYDHYTEVVPGSLEQLQQRLRQENSSPSRSWQTFWSRLIAWTTSRPSAAHSNPNKANTAPNTQTIQVTQKDGESAARNIPGNAGSESAARGPPLSGSTDIFNALQSPQPQVHPEISYLLLCFPEGLSGLRLHHQQIMHAAGQRSLPNQVINDKQLFHLLRKKYASERRPFISRFWPKTVIRVSLAYFLVDLSEYIELKHYACQDGRANCKCIPPPNMIQPATNAQYYCVPRDPPLKPPIGTNYLTHYFQNPDCIKSESLVCILNQIPKRLGQCIPTSGNQRVEAWGMEFEEGWDRGRLRNAIFGIVIIGCLLFAVLWSVLFKDLQSAFGVSSFFVAVLTTIGGYIASAEPRIVHK